MLSARGGELERELAFGVVRQLFEAAVSEPLLDGAAAAAREVFDGPASGVGRRGRVVRDPARAVPADGQPRRAAPLLLVVDDLQWCDEPSLRWLCYLVRRLDGLPRHASLCGVRPFERHAHAHLIGEIARDPLAVALQPQAAERARERRADRRRDEVFARACHDATGGNPLLLVELAKALRAEGVPPDAAHVAAVDAIAPRAASRAVLVRIGRLSPTRRRWRARPPCSATTPRCRSWPSSPGLDDAAAVAAAGELVGAEVFADQAAMAFVHPLIRAAVYEDIPVHERSLAHERAARLLRDRAALARCGRHAAGARAAARRGVGRRRPRARRRAPRSARARPRAPRRT